jgi:hypothetical protein
MSWQNGDQTSQQTRHEQTTRHKPSQRTTNLPPSHPIASKSCSFLPKLPSQRHISWGSGAVKHQDYDTTKKTQKFHKQKIFVAALLNEG